MKRELEEALRRDYPSFFRDLYGSPPTTCMAYGLTCEDGWEPIVRRLCQELTPLVPADFKFEQIKEKFGTLRVYVAYEPDCDSDLDGAIHQAIEEAELASWETCEFCGIRDDEVRCKGTSYIRTLCPLCRAPSEKEMK